MSHYHQLTAFDRGRIEVLLREGLSMRSIAKEIGRSASTISREIARCVGSTYEAEDADQKHRL
ncbi:MULTISPECIES: helix-turn-helix domain-containing protein [Weissella]|uniref:Helix-turn-helix domain-containing protein n=1 Tax=Weissella fermenti TaxID=2987699 RepID=A0ABT6D7K5_9LACO|nr:MULTISPECIES: helix-turn-helix domain-containing protein [unclassified Weissella]MCW0927921.1 helix-turn-helix domain-containing protein [Weissella sp. LMG 11983]MDF9300510.1 helix-turn-helix domain-containing protein [Weissella sp. BK2]